MSRKTVIPFGPQHPVLPEPLQLRLVLEDEKVVEAVPAIGYIHRGLEKIAEKKDFVQNVYLAERICGICSFLHAQNYCQGIETLMGLAVPPRAAYLRVVWGEIHRIHSHLLYLGLMADAFGFENLFMQTMRFREDVLDVMEQTSGNRVLLTTCCIGGVRRDIDAAGADLVRRMLDGLERAYRDLYRWFDEDYSVRRRLVGVGAISKETCAALGGVGPVAKSCGIPIDLRASGLYGPYRELGFQPVTETGGDSFARTKVRLREIRQCMELIRAALDRAPAGELAVPVKGNPDGEVLARIEQPRGELCFFIKANGTKNLDRFRVRTPTFANLAPLLHMLGGCELADVPVIVISIDPCISCMER